MADGIRATPYQFSAAGTANDIIGGLLGYMRDPRRTQQMQGLAGLLESTGIPKSVERFAYGEPLTNIRQANVPMLRPETADALMTLLPVPAGVNRAARAVDPLVQRYGPRLETAMEPMLAAAYNRGGLTREMVEAMGSGTRSNVFLDSKPLTPNPQVGSRYITQPVGGLADKTPTKIEDLQGSSLMILPWDSTTRNMRVMSVSDEMLPVPVVTQGGQDFARDLQNIASGVGGASNEAIAKRILARSVQAQKENLAAGGTGDVYMLPSTMSMYGENFSTMPTEVLLQLIDKADLPKSRIKSINESVRNFKNQKGEQNFTGFKGIETAEGRQQLFTGEGVDDTAGELRKAFVNRMYLKDNQKAVNFNEEDLINAVTDDSLRGLPRGYAGNTIIQANPSGILTPSTHSSYSTNFPGAYAGSLEGGLLGNVPVEILLPKAYGRIEQEFAGKAGDMRSNVIGALEKRGQGFSDVVDQEMIDNYYKYIEREMRGLLD
jgi:hypothetical protein